MSAEVSDQQPAEREPLTGKPQPSPRRLPAAPPRPSPRAPLSRERIIEAALQIIDNEGVEAVSMRRIAATLGVQAMSLYNHVGGKSDVLDGVIEFITTDMGLTRQSGRGWEDGIRSVAYAFRRASLRHPRAVELVLTRQISSPGALPVINCSLAVLLDHGFDEAAAVHALRLLVAFQVGSLLGEFHSPGFGSETGEEDEEVRRREQHLSNSGFPAVAKLAPKLAEIDHAAEFTFGLELLIDALRQYAPQQPERSRQD